MTANGTKRTKNYISENDGEEDRRHRMDFRGGTKDREYNTVPNVEFGTHDEDGKINPESAETMIMVQ